MNIHEYQAKEILERNGVVIQEGHVCETIEEVEKAAKLLTKEYGPGQVVKAQIHAGGRGKGGGVKFGKTVEEVVQYGKDILGMTLVTPQTDAAGKLVRKVLVNPNAFYEGPNEPKELYVSILLDRGAGMDIIMASTEGGMDIEEVAEATPEKIFKVRIDPTTGLQGFQARQIAFGLELEGLAFKNMVKFLFSLYKAYQESDASMFEINPVLKASDDAIIAIDAKVNIDDNALYRHKDIAAMLDVHEEDPLELEAAKYDLNYVKLDGNVGCMVNGAGLAMATMDMIKLSGGEPANFLDVGGGANATTVEAGFRIILKDPNVKAILINIFGGIVRCDRVANGVVEAYKAIGQIDVPIIVRLQGTNAEEGAKIINESGLNVISATILKDAAERVREVLA